MTARNSALSRLLSGTSAKKASETRKNASMSQKVSRSNSSAKAKQNDPIGTANVTCASLNVRSGAGTNYARIGGLSKGKSVQVYEEKDGWLRILYENKEGWISKEFTDFVSPEPVTKPDPKPDPEPDPEPEPEKTEKKEVVTTDALNLRNVPGNGGSPASGSSVYVTIPAGTKLTVEGEQNGWYKVSYGGYSGWCCAEYTTEYKAPDISGGAPQSAANYAAQFIGRTTKDLVGTIPYLEDISWAEGTNNGYNLNCANFVSAVLKNFNLIGSHVINITNLKSQLSQFGYQTVSKSQCKPGDVWCTSEHTELVYSNSGGTVKLVGSNNGGDSIQEVSFDTWSPNNYSSALYYSCQ